MPMKLNSAKAMKISALTTEPFRYHALDFLFRVGNIHIALGRFIYGNISVLRSFQALATRIWSRSRWREIRFSDRLIKRFRVLARNGYLNIGVLALANGNGNFLKHRAISLAEAHRCSSFIFACGTR